MEKASFQIQIPEDLIPLLDDLAEGGSLDHNVRISLAISLFLTKTVSLARAAEIAMLPLSDFISIMRRKKIPWSEYTEDDLVADQSFLKDLEREIAEND